MDTLRQLKLTKDNYLEEAGTDPCRKEQCELSSLCKARYDEESCHGTLIAAQEKWNKLLKELLTAQSCYK